MKIHLTIANLLVLLVLCPWRFVWLATYSWMGGNVLCKIANYIFMVAVDMPCYIITCIAIDRCRIVYRMTSSRKVCEFIIYVLSIVTSQYTG
jgi:hypothetical protein